MQRLSYNHHAKIKGMLSLSKRTRVKKLIIASLAIPTLFFAASSFMVSPDDGIKVGKKTPMMTEKMDGVDGTQHSLTDLMGKNGLMVVFSCNTCPFVVGNNNFDGWERQYNDLYEAAQKSGIGFVLINSNAAKRGDVDSMKEMMKHSKEQAYKMHYLVDENSALADAFGAKTTPHLFAIDGTGKLVFKGSIDNSWDSSREELRTYAKDVIAHLGDGKSLKDKSSKPRGCSIKRNGH